MLNKKIYLLGILIVLAGLVFMPVKIQAVSSGSCTLGDASGDGILDAADETVLAAMVAGTAAPTAAADLDGDGIIGPGDISLMRLNLATGVYNPVGGSAPVAFTAGNISCVLPTANITYSKDSGATWNSSATVRKGDILKIKATFSGAFTGNGQVYISIDNGLESNAPMAQINPTTYSYNLNVVTTGNISPATVSIAYGSFINNGINITSGATFDIVNRFALVGPLPSTCYLGDTNGDGLIDANDATSVAAMVAGTASPTLAADIDGDGIVSPSDVVAMRLALAQGAASPLVTSPVSCALPTAVVIYSKDAGVTYASTATVKKGDILKIKATLNHALTGNGGVFLSIDNGLESNAPMAQINPTTYSYDLNVVSTGNISPATVSITYGSLINNSITITSGSTFRIINTPVSVGGGGGGSGSIDTTAPTNTSIQINNGAQTTDTLTVTLALAAQDSSGPLAMMISNDSNFTDAVWETFNASKTWELTADYNLKTVYAQFKDFYGNISAPVLATITLVPPQAQTPTAGLTPAEQEVLGAKYVDERELQLTQIYDDAHYIWPGDTALLLGYLNASRNLALEQSMSIKYGPLLDSNLKIALASLESSNTIAVTNFLAYGTKTTLKLGAGERAGVLNSYKSAYGQLPKTEENWRDAIKIANGRWPSQVSSAAEKQANVNFNIVYKRNANMSNANDNAAVTTMAYGLRPQPRNIGSEASAIKIFKGVYGYYPVKATAWDVVRAIAYSGAVR